MSTSPSSDRKKIIEARLKAAGLSVNQIVIGDGFNAPRDYVPTGVPEVDSILGDFPGIPEGSVVEFCGESQSGKTYLALKTIAEAQKKKKRCAFFNIEKAFYAPRAKAIGVDVTNAELFEMYKGDGTAEQNGNLILELVKSKDYGVIVVDSITAMQPSANYVKNLDDAAKIGAHATFVSDFVKRLTGLCDDSGTTVILINQFRYGAGVQKGTFAKKSTGGEAMAFYCHLRLWINKVGGVDGLILNSDKEIIGGKSKLLVVKNRFGIAKEEIKMPIYFTEGEKPDALAEFIMRAKSKYNQCITETRKVLKYIVDETGEVLESKNPKIFIQKLKEAPAPLKKVKGDNSTNAFEYICRKIKFDEKSVDALNIRLLDDNDSEISEETPDFDDMSPNDIIEMLGEE